jgi:hypothetical protein
MSLYTTVSPFAVGGSAVIVAAREVEVADRAVRAFGGCRSPLALAALAVARGDFAEGTVAQKPGACRTTLAVVRGEEPLPRTETKVSLTARWVRDNYAKVYPALVAHLASKMPLSRELSVVEDHVQTVLARFVERDTLAPFLRDGKEVKLSVLRVWAYQSASTELRRWGVDASTRMTRGAKTAREVQAGKAWRVVQSADTAREVVRDREDTLSTPDLHDPAAPSPEDALARKSRVDMVRRHLTRIGQPHLASAVEHVLNGGAVADLPGGIAAKLTAVLRDLRA